MNDQIRKLYEQARQLSSAEQRDLAELLEAATTSDEQIEAEWQIELSDRLAALDDGSAKLTPADEFLAELGGK